MRATGPVRASPAAAAGARRAGRSPIAPSRPPPTLPTALHASRAAPGAAPRSAVVAAAKKKGFGGKGGDAAKPADVKLSKRGTVASRGGVMSRKELDAQDAAFQAGFDASDDRAPGPRMTPPTASPPSGFGATAEVSPIVNNRVFRRMLTFSGVPVLLGVALFPAFYYLKKVLEVDVPTYAVYIVQTFTFGAGLLGISYGVLSASWDPTVEGSALGGAEFRANLATLVDRGRVKRDTGQ